MIILKVKKRDIKESLNKIRKEGEIPAVFYGKKETSTPIQLSYAIFEKIFKEVGESTVLHLEGENIDIDVLIHDVDLDPITDKPRHVDFYAIEKGKKIEVSIPLEFTGIAPAIKDLKGILVKVMHEIEIEAVPADLPHKLEIDISSLITFDDIIMAKDIKLPKGVSLKIKPEEVIASVYEPKEEIIETAMDISTIEVTKKGKEAKKDEGENVETEKEIASKEEKKK
ncbi:MAG: 50S ribosomal protein L25 [bacterium]